MVWVVGVKLFKKRLVRLSSNSRPWSVMHGTPETTWTRAPPDVWQYFVLARAKLQPGRDV